MTRKSSARLYTAQRPLGTGPGITVRADERRRAVGGEVLLPLCCLEKYLVVTPLCFLLF